jgi:osmotically inducible protein OsmC
MKTLFTAHATSIAGRDGNVASDNGNLNLKLVRPSSGEAGTNPEELFACGYSACFGGAVTAVAKKGGLEDPGKVEVKAAVSLNQDDNGFFISAVLDVTIEKADAATALQIVRDAHQRCPYTTATRGNVEVTLTANGQAVS